MKKINFYIEGEEYMIFVGKKEIEFICSVAGGIEQGGYIFANKIKNTNEYKIDSVTPPHEKDICNMTFIKFSRQHRKKSKKIRKNNPFLYEIGFYHTHPESYGFNPSCYDLNIFHKKSLNHKISLFIIALKKKTNIFIYSYGEKIKEEEIWAE